MERITRKELKTMMDRGDDFVLVDVLGSDDFGMRHLPHAINVPVGESFPLDIQQAVPDRDTPVVVYCANLDCSASSTAAEHLDRLGYRAVYDYAAGKMDWVEAGLPVDGGNAPPPR